MRALERVARCWAANSDLIEAREGLLEIAENYRSAARRHDLSATANSDPLAR